MNWRSNYVAIMILAFAVTLSLPNTVFAQMSPWSLFQRLCQSGGLATGPQCQNLGISSPSTTTNSVCGTNAVLQNGVCVPISSSTTTNSVCGTNAVLQNGVCVPISSSSSSSLSTTGTCPTNFILQNGVCVP
jgi:hypothetical protein